MALQGVDIANSLDNGVFADPMGRDIHASLDAALRAGVVFASGNDPLTLFRSAVSRAVRDIESHERGKLLQRLLRDGPCDPDETFSPELAERRLSDTETASAVNFIRSQVVNSFQGSIAEMLAVAPCLALMRDLQRARSLPAEAGLYVGETVTAPQFKRSRTDKAADLHILVEPHESESTVTLAGVVEVKSYPCSPAHLKRQLEGHLLRARLGFRVGERRYLPHQICIGHGPKRRIVKIIVVPATWRLPRTFAFKEGSRALWRTLEVAEPVPPTEGHAVTQIEQTTWRIMLRWSHEAIAATAYELTFWYMSKVGEVVWASGSPWPEMTPSEAGLNAVKWAMNLAPLRAGSRAQYERAVALCNIYGFGYAVGNNFRSENDGRRAVLFPLDLEEIAAVGRTKYGFMIV